ncbi:caspase family protein [Methylobacterium nodulans]|uniref:caspase family protein n=1 Tax=Methylobacterium nodulans TaxID=114616 RepID=UPI0001619948|nr:caspase family protein [Methylobacterium nodulans]
MHTLLHFLVSAIALLVGQVAARAADSRTALVIGVSTYQYTPRLPNTLNDARAISQALQRLGFSVQTVLDPDRLAMEVAVRRFGEEARKADAAVFFYAGHALEVGGRSWLLPVTTRVEAPRDLRFEALDLEAVLEQTEGGARVSILFLDACRDNPLQRRLSTGSRDLPRAGLGQVSAGIGTLIAFATAPGMVAADGKGPNSPFTAALLHHLETPGLEVRQMLSAVRREVREATRGAQIPWENSALEGEFYFYPADTKSPTNDLAKMARTELQDSHTDSSSPLALSIRDRLHNLLPNYRPDRLELNIKEYIKAKGHKAIAITYEKNGTWRVHNRSSRAAAAEAALEGCQVYYGRPCALAVTDGDVEKIPPGKQDIPTQNMSRVNYDGLFDPERIPNANLFSTRSPEVLAYRSAPALKAAAYHPWGRIFVVSGRSAQQAAEEEALAQCNADPDRNGRDGSCYLYAVGDRVVLKERLTKPASASPVP